MAPTVPRWVAVLGVQDPVGHLHGDGLPVTSTRHGPARVAALRLARLSVVVLACGASSAYSGSYDAARSMVEAACPGALSSSAYTATCGPPPGCAQP